MYIPLSLPTALTVDNVLRELKDVSWETLSEGKTLSDGRYWIPGVLSLPKFQQNKIAAEYSTEDQQRNAAVHLWLVSDPYASWRRLITQLDYYEEHAVVKQIDHYAEKLTGMKYTCTHLITASFVYEYSITVANIAVSKKLLMIKGSLPVATILLVHLLEDNNIIPYM